MLAMDPCIQVEPTRARLPLCRGAAAQAQPLPLLPILHGIGKRAREVRLAVPSKLSWFDQQGLWCSPPLVGLRLCWFELQGFPVLACCGRKHVPANCAAGSSIQEDASATAIESRLCTQV